MRKPPRLKQGQVEAKTKQGEPGSSVTKPGDGIQGETGRRLTDVWSRVVLVARLPIWSKESTQTTGSQSHRGFWVRHAQAGLAWEKVFLLLVVTLS